MQKDTRNLTVAREHLRAAYDEVTTAQGQSERSIVEAAVRRAITHLDLVSRRLEQEREILGRGATANAVERAFAATRLAWQGLHDLLNDWPDSVARALDPVRVRLLEAAEALEEACRVAGPEEAMHP